MLRSPDATFLGGSRELLAGASLEGEASWSTGISVKSSNHSGRSCDWIPNAGSMSSFLSLVSGSHATGPPVLDCVYTCFVKMLDLAQNLLLIISGQR